MFDGDAYWIRFREVLCNAPWLDIQRYGPIRIQDIQSEALASSDPGSPLQRWMLQR